MPHQLIGVTIVGNAADTAPLTLLELQVDLGMPDLTAVRRPTGF
jgi:hypothetical protein